MDLSKLAASVKGIQRRTTQKVLQQMGMADKTTEDDSPAYQNFLALGSFASQLKTTIQGANTCFEKSCTAETHLAGQIQSYLASELSGDDEMPPGELHDFFNGNDATRQHAIILQAVSGKFYEACSELGNNALHAVIGRLEDLVVRPITNDEDFAAMTKEIVDEKKKATLDYDSFRRLAQNNTNPAEHDRLDAKVRSAKDRLEQSNRRLAEHVDTRNHIRCKLLIHGILTAMQQYCNYYNHAMNIFRDTALSLKPMLEIYQLSEDQLQSALNLNNIETKFNPNRAKSPQGQNSPSSVFDDYAAQDKHNNNNNNGNYPKSSVHKSAAAQPPPRTTSPLDTMMQNNLNLGSKPTSQPLKHAPMNQYNTGNRHSPQPPPRSGSPQRPHSPQLPPSHHQGSQFQPSMSSTPPQQQKPAPIDLFSDDIPQPQQSQQNHSPKLTAKPPPQPVLVDLMASQGDLLFGGPLQGSTAPTLQPRVEDPFSTAFGLTPTAPSHPPKVVTPPSSHPPASTSDLLFGTPPLPHSNFQNAQNDPFASFTSNNSNNASKTAAAAAKNEFDDLFGSSSPEKKKSSAPPPAASQPRDSGQHQDKRQELNPAVTARIENWANRGGRKTNLRALLSTLHEVIWVDSGWDAMPLGDLLTGGQVKKAYIRANLIVHPDKVQTGTMEQQLIAQRIFEALRVSYEAFKTEAN